MLQLRRPLESEHAPAFRDEIALVPDAPDFSAMLRDNVRATRALALTFGEEGEALSYAPGKWSVRQVIGH
ncbi:MAG TPA: hypothetical protein VFV33_20510, partial [Gemmatimonadaceae bacterium]|nr:hypothetical protein [Gemmatimonadaceae bacterium]